MGILDLVKNMKAVLITTWLAILLPALASPGFLKEQDLAPSPTANYTEQNFTVLIDNYGFNTSATFQIRYLYDNQFWKTGGPIIFYCGNEGAIEMFIEASGFLPVLAKNLGGALVFAEHRYFGKSLPFGDKSFSHPNLTRYLSPHQAMADYAYLLDFLSPVYNNAPVIVTGGSYGAMLAAWMRMKFPHVADISYAASAPIFHVPGTVPPELYNHIISNDYRAVDESCYSTIRYGFDALSNFVKNSDNYFHLQELFETCEDVTDEYVAHYTIEWLYNAYEYMAMTDYPYPTNFLSPMPGWPVTASCSYISKVTPQKDSNWTIIQAMKDSANIYYNYTGKLECNEIIQDYDNSLGDDGWDYLACSTLVLPIGADGVNDMFLPAPWDYKAYAHNCYLNYTRYPQPEYVQTFYGSSTPQNDYYSLRYFSNMIFTNGRLDPWQSGAVLDSTYPGVLSLNIDQGAHHLDLRAPNPLDPIYVTEVRRVIQSTLGAWSAGIKH